MCQDRGKLNLKDIIQILLPYCYAVVMLRESIRPY
jgi:hypothetical protein